MLHFRKTLAKRKALKSKNKAPSEPEPETLNVTSISGADKVCMVPVNGSSSGQNALSSKSLQGAASPKGHASVLTQQRAKFPDRRLDPLGLTILHEPTALPTLDIIFVHGLGGSSRQTWSKDRDPALFWPQEWLPSEPVIQTARILTFGYNADFLGPANISRISDFAKDLLYAVQFMSNDSDGDARMSKRPIIFVAHSMGGLVVKKAYIIGQNDDTYRDTIASIKSIVFLSTPHRGSNLAPILSRLLTLSHHSSKRYISELEKGSSTLEDINELFRHIAPKLQIFSLYETLHTSIGPKKEIIVDKDSSILNYPGEVSVPLNADHHTVCKYSSPNDPNYIRVRNALKGLVSDVHRKATEVTEAEGKEYIAKITEMLGVAEAPTEDFKFFRDRWRLGTCDWITDNNIFDSWLQDPTESRVLWICAPPGTGKSVLTTYIINTIVERSKLCCYFFFRFSDQLKRSPATCLRSLAFQAAEQVPEFCKALAEIKNSILKLERADAKTIWRRVFIDVLFKIPVSRPLYLVIDALDEADSPSILAEILAGCSSSQIPVKILLASRDTVDLRLAFDRLALDLQLDIISIANETRDIKLFVEHEIKLLKGVDLETKDEIAKTVLAKANGNFLWVTMALNEILHSYTPEEIEEVLERLPDGMEDMYLRMEISQVNSLKPAHKIWARKILLWVICSRRPLGMDELSEALQPEVPSLNLGRMIMGICGQFIIVDTLSSKVLVLHETASHFLTTRPDISLYIDPLSAHETLFLKCIRYIDSQTSLKGALLSYAATSWAYHLEQCPPDSEEVFDCLTEFLRKQSILAWISTLATLGEIKELVSASMSLAKYIHRRKDHLLTRDSSSRLLSDLKFIGSWAMDIKRIVSQFSEVLMDHPAAIFKLIPPFCPRSSMIFQQFAKDSTLLNVSGLSSQIWDDNIGRVNFPPGSLAKTILCSGDVFAVVPSPKNIIIYDSTTFEKTTTIEQKEYVLCMCFSHNGDMIACASLNATRIWHVRTGSLLFEIPRPARTKAIDLIFSTDDSKLIMTCDIGALKSVSLNNIEEGWLPFAEGLLPMHGTPSCIAFDADIEHVAVGYRKFPLSVLRVEPVEMVAKCMRDQNPSNWTVVERVIWHPKSSTLIGRYEGGTVFKWNPYTGVYQEMTERFVAKPQIACSPNGKLVTVADKSGAKVYNFHSFTLLYEFPIYERIIDIGFSPDSRRIYDLRKGLCNIWELPALIYLTDSEDGTGGMMAPMALNPGGSHSPITVLGVQNSAKSFVSGNDAGLVQVYEEGGLVDLWQDQSKSPIRHIDIEPNAHNIAILASGGQVHITSLIPSSDLHKAIHGNAERTINPRTGSMWRNILQIVLSASSKELFSWIQTSATQTSAMIWSVETKELIGTIDISLESPARKWINHPSNPNFLLSFEVGCIKAYRWDDFSEVATLAYPETTSTPALDDTAGNLGDEFRSRSAGKNMTGEINRLIISPDKLYIILQHSCELPNRRQHTVIFESKSFDRIEQNRVHTVPIIEIPIEVQSQINVPLCVLPQRKLVFIDKKYWVCTWQQRTLLGENILRKHYFIPRDWLSGEALRLSTMLADGTLLFPKDGEVALIKSREVHACKDLYCRSCY
ncbi:hypothetical protein F5884DRAFT_781773 [Xylogone sp. PMI_703]|nr:hypothetical protein F5884DRAFT_781773 [Xylogone sp. PMI_703]